MDAFEEEREKMTEKADTLEPYRLGEGYRTSWTSARCFVYHRGWSIFSANQKRETQPASMLVCHTLCLCTMLFSKVGTL